MKKYFGRIMGKDIFIFELKDKDLKINILNYGAIIKNILFKGKNTILGFNTLEDYINDTLYTGAFVGRNAGRISNASFKIHNKSYFLEKNNENINLHSGSYCLSKKVFEYNLISNKELELKLVEEENQFPGNVDIKIHFKIKNNGLFINILATTDKDTIFNPTYHIYFNFNKNLNKDIGNHYLKINSDFYLELNKDSLPTGKIFSVNSTLDFNKFKRISKNLNDDFLKDQKGYDHPYLLSNSIINAEILNRDQKIHMKLKTDLPSLIFYSGNFIQENYYANNSSERCGFCLEPQFYPDFINKFNKNYILKKGEIYKRNISYSFFDI